MATLTDEQRAFLRDTGVPIDRVFDATGKPNPIWQKAMSEQGKWIAYGVSPCEAEGHTLRTRSGHCVQCSPERIGYLRRHDEAGTVYVAYSPAKRIVKVGTAQRADRINQLNFYRYGGTQDWRKEFLVACERAGKVESIAQQSLTKYTIAGTYFKGGHWIECYELFGCDLPIAITAVKEALRLVVGLNHLTPNPAPSDVKGSGIAPPAKNASEKPIGTRSTVAQLATDLKIPADVLIEQLQKAGVTKSNAGDLLSEQDKSRLLENLRRSHEKTQPVQVEIRRKRILVKRAPVGLCTENPETVTAPAVDQTGEARMNLSNEDLILLYFAARDRRAKRKAAFENDDIEDRAKQIDIESLLIERMNHDMTDSISSSIGTAYRSSRTSALVENWHDFLTFVKQESAWNMLSERCDKESVLAYIQQNGCPPPGVRWQQDTVVNIRRNT